MLVVLYHSTSLLDYSPYIAYLYIRIIRVRINKMNPDTDQISGVSSAHLPGAAGDCQDKAPTLV